MTDIQKDITKNIPRQILCQLHKTYFQYIPRMLARLVLFYSVLTYTFKPLSSINIDSGVMQKY